MTHRGLILGIDGGGSKTVAWTAAVEDADTVAGQGAAGPSNVMAVGWPIAAQNLLAAMQEALRKTGASIDDVAAMCVGIAGSDRPAVRDQLQTWLTEIGFCGRLSLAHDGMLVLAAGSPRNQGIALIAGTGSLAFGRNADGEIARVGGWGYRLGDEGSGYAIALEGLRAIARAADGRGPATSLAGAMLQELKIATPAELVEVLYAGAMTPRHIAALAPVVLREASSNDGVAVAIVRQAGALLAEHVATLAHKLSFASAGYDLALAGGVLTQDTGVRESLESALQQTYSMPPQKLSIVSQPVSGAIQLAQALLHS